MQDLERCVFGSVAMAGLRGEFPELWQGKDLTGHRTSAHRSFLMSERREYPLPAQFLKRYDSKRVRGWGSAKRLIPWDLGESEGKGNRRSEGAANER